MDMRTSPPPSRGNHVDLLPPPWFGSVHIHLVIHDHRQCTTVRIPSCILGCAGCVLASCACTGPPGSAQPIPRHTEPNMHIDTTYMRNPQCRDLQTDTTSPTLGCAIDTQFPTCTLTHKLHNMRHRKLRTPRLPWAAPGACARAACPARPGSPCRPCPSTPSR